MWILSYIVSFSSIFLAPNCAITIYRDFRDVTHSLNLSIIAIYFPLCGEKVNLIDPVNCCLLQQKRGSCVGHGPRFEECAAPRLALVLKHRASHTCVLKLNRDPD